MAIVTFKVTLSETTITLNKLIIKSLQNVKLYKHSCVVGHCCFGCQVYIGRAYLYGNTNNNLPLGNILYKLFLGYLKITSLQCSGNSIL